MHIKKFRIIILFTLFTLSHLANSATEVYEDFSSSLNLQKFTDIESGIELDAINQNLKMSIKGSAFTQNSRNNNLAFSNQNIDFIQADFNIDELIVDNPSTQRVLIGFGGNFYKGTSGIVAAIFTIGERGNGPEAWYDIFEFDTSFNRTSTISGTIALLSKNTTYTSSISYDGNNTFEFAINSGNPVSVVAPAKESDTTDLYKFIGNWIGFGQDFSTGAAASDDGSITSISVTIDNVITSATAPALLDDFSASSLDVTKWNDGEFLITTTSDGQLKMIAKQPSSGNSTQRLHLTKKNLKYFGAKLTLLSDSILGASNSRVRGRLVHYLGNDTYDIENGATSNGNEGDIFTQLTIEDNEGVLRAFIYASKVTDPNFATETELFFINLPLAIAYDQQYSLVIETVGTVVNYKVDGITYHSFDMATHPQLSGNIFPTDTPSSLQARVHRGPGEAHVLFDDVITDIDFAFNIDNSGNAEPPKPLTDGLLILRYIFGFNGDALIENAIADNAIRNSSEQVGAYIQLGIDEGALDIDGNGEVKPLTDGLLVLRYLFGFRGDSLINSVIGTGATRNSASEIENHLQLLMGT